MNPLLKNGELVFTLKMPLARVLKRKIKVSDILIFELSTGHYLIKRVYGFSGDKVWIDNFQVFINNKNVTAEYKLKYLLKNRIDCKYSEVFEVPPNEVFVLGDNLCLSADSRYIGTISKDKIHGIVVAQVPLLI